MNTGLFNKIHMVSDTAFGYSTESCRNWQLFLWNSMLLPICSTNYLTKAGQTNKK